MAQVGPQPDTRRKALVRVLQLDPSHRKARALLNALDEKPKVVEEEIVVRRTQRPSLRRTLSRVIGCGILVFILIAVLLGGILQLLQKANSAVLDARDINTTLTALAVSSTPPTGRGIAATNTTTVDVTKPPVASPSIQLAQTQQSIDSVPTVLISNDAATPQSAAPTANTLPPATIQPLVSSSTIQAHGALLTFGVGGGQDHILQLWKANPDGSNPTSITDKSTFVFPGFSWSPDGKQVAFFGIRAQQFGLYRFDSAANPFQTISWESAQ